MDKSKRKQVTMQDIAQAVGVSKNAVSLALSNKPGVSDDMRSQILKTAQLLGYRIPAQKKEKKECIVVVIPEYLNIISLALERPAEALPEYLTRMCGPGSAHRYSISKLMHVKMY